MTDREICLRLKQMSDEMEALMRCTTPSIAASDAAVDAYNRSPLFQDALRDMKRLRSIAHGGRLQHLDGVLHILHYRCLHGTANGEVSPSWLDIREMMMQMFDAYIGEADE